MYAWLALRPAKPCGIHARHPCRGYITGATAPSPCRGLCLKARTLWLLAKSFARCKTHKASNARHPIFINDIGLSTDRNGAYQADMLRFACINSLLFNVLLLYLLVFIYDSKLPIVLFVGQHFSGSLFKSMHLSILTRERTKGTRESLSLAYARLVHSAKAPLDCRSEAKRND